MSSINTFYEYGVAKATKQPGIIDAITESAKIVSSMPVEEASDQYWNTAEVLSEVNGPGLVDMDGVLPTMNTESGLVQVDLSTFGGIMEGGIDKIKLMGGAANYFGKKLIPQTRSFAQAMEASIIYNNLRSYAILNSNTASATGAGTTNYSMIAVTWTPGEITGLVNPEGFGRGEVLDMAPLGNGGVYKDSAGKLVQGVYVKTNFGVQLLNKRYVSAIVNIDFTNKYSAFTERIIDDMLLNARQNENTKIYCHPRVLMEMQAFKASRLNVFNQDNGINRKLNYWNETEIITSYNFLNGSETTVS